MAAVHILIFGEMAGFKIVSFIATHVKMKKKIHGAMKKIFSANQNLPIGMKTTDIKLLTNGHISLKLQAKLCKSNFGAISSQGAVLEDSLPLVTALFYV